VVSCPPTRARTVFSTPSPKRSEEGYILLGVLILLALFTIAMAVALPKVAADIQRDRDVETLHRGKQYIRAIQLYYRKFGNYPPNLDALVKTNDIKFLRKQYIDPMTGKVDWKPIMFGMNKTPLAMGFFGQPLGGPGAGATPIAGIGPSGSSGVPGGSTFGGTPAGGGSFNSSPNGGTDSFSSSPTSPTNPTGPTGGLGTGGPSGNGTNGTGATDPNGNPVQGQTFGGAGIIGVSPVSPKQSIYVYKKKNHYNQWEFLYSPLQDTQTVGGGGANIGTPAGNLGQPGFGQTGIGQPGPGQPGQPSIGQPSGGSPASPISSPNPQ
jgi:type II secretory pathway pseudopilin PulG